MADTATATATEPTAYDKARAHMRETAPTTPQLAYMLGLLEGIHLDEGARSVRAALADEFCARVPEANAAGEQWADDPEAPHSYTRTILEAAALAGKI